MEYAGMSGGWWIAFGIIAFIAGMLCGASLMSDAYHDDLNNFGKVHIQHVTYQCTRIKP